MPTARRYKDPCGIARALDVLGDRWALLVVRELIFEPQRFIQLRGNLRGISPNVLSQRLRDLAEAGVVRLVLDPVASVAVYELTDRGRALEPVLIELGRWGSAEPSASSRELTGSALLLALKTVFDPAAAAGIDAMFALRIDGDWFRVRVADGAIAIAHGRAEQPAVSFDTDVATLRAVAFGRVPLSAAERDGRLVVHGDRTLAAHFTRMFPAPTGSAVALSGLRSAGAGPAHGPTAG